MRAAIRGDEQRREFRAARLVLVTANPGIDEHHRGPAIATRATELDATGTDDTGPDTGNAQAAVGAFEDPPVTLAPAGDAAKADPADMRLQAHR